MGGKGSGRRPKSVATTAKHLTAREVAVRSARELTDRNTSVIVPPFLEDDDLRNRFLLLAGLLIERNAWDATFCELLGRYVKAQEEYEAVTAEVDRLLSEGELGDAAALSRMQSKYFDQANKCATMLGMDSPGLLRAPVREEAPEDDFSF